MTLFILDTDLIGGAKLGASVLPRPSVRLFTEKTLSTVSVTVTKTSNFETFAFSIFAHSIAALEAVRAASTIVQVLIERGHFPAIRLSSLL